MTRSKRKTAPEQLELLSRRGGKRRGAGRPPKGPRAGSPHKKRPFLHPRYPVHVTLRAIAAVGKLRNGRAYRAVREATITVRDRDDFRTVHLSIQHDHIHLLVEAKTKEALAVGMKGFQISAAKHLDAAISKGKPGRGGAARCSPTAITPRSSPHRHRRAMRCRTCSTISGSTRKT